jgi:uncharacterized protein Usg
MATRKGSDAMRKIDDDFRKQCEGYGLVTACVLYRMPDYPDILQTYIWQNFDCAPDFPVLHKFLKFWNDNLEGPLYSVTIGHAHLIKPVEINNAAWLN